jgi:hypothetical protein
MLEHVKVLGWVGIIRALLGACLGGFFIFKSTRLSLSATPEWLDPTPGLLQLLGGLCVALAMLRLAQGIGALRVWTWARAAGLILGAFDLSNLLLFPVSTALGLYALVVYRHPETVERFRWREKEAGQSSLQTSLTNVK